MGKNEIGMTYFKYPPPKLKHEGTVIYFNSLHGIGTIRESTGMEFPFKLADIICRRIEAGDRVSFTEGLDMGHPSAISITKY
jgi:cold shock CspA family protein